MTSSATLLHMTRGPLVESLHRGHLAVTDSRGRVLYSAGDPEQVIFARSSMKPIQAIPVIESGAADAFGFTPSEIALMCASHNGEAEHIATVSSMLARLGLSGDSLQCGPHEPYHKPSADRMKKAGEAFTSLHNNCSGKHAGMLALANHWDADRTGYLDPEHPVQQAMLRTVSEMCGTDQGSILLGVDGCGVPVFGLPLNRLAAGFATLAEQASEEQPRDSRSAACRRIWEALSLHPFQLAGSGRFDTKLIEATRGRIIGKMGAEGVFALADRSRGLGLALKIEDGAQRALYPVITEALVLLQWVSTEEAETLSEFHKPEIRNWKGTVVGRMEPVLPLKFEG